MAPSSVFFKKDTLVGAENRIHRQEAPRLSAGFFLTLYCHSTFPEFGRTHPHPLTILFAEGVDIRTLENNDVKQVEAELQKKLPAAMEGGGYILHTDHSISTRVEYETYCYFIRRGLEIGTYC
jgi:hypothetical protein